MDEEKTISDTYEQIAEKYTQAFYNDLTDARYIDNLLKELPRGSNILDIGSGPGQFSKYIKNKGYEVMGIDISDAMIKIANNRVPQVNFKKMDMRNMEFDADTYDGILAAYSIIHIQSKDLNRVFQEFYRVLKQNGLALIIAQKGDPDKIVAEPLNPDLNIFINLFSEERLKAYAENADFNVENIIIANQQTEEDVFSDEIIYLYIRK